MTTGRYRYCMPERERMAKYLLLSLSFGMIDPQRFELAFDRCLEDYYSEALRMACSRGWLKKISGEYLLCDGSFRNIHLIRSLFYTRDAVDWLASLKEIPATDRAATDY